MLARLGIPMATLAVASGLLLTAVHTRENVIVTIDPERPIEEVWEQKSFGEPTRIGGIAGRRAIEAVGQASAAGLFRSLRFTVSEHPIVEWAWRVDRLPEAADVRTERADDFGASLFLLFGRPGLLRPEPPTLAYAWTSEATPEGAVIASPCHPGTLQIFVLESGSDNLGEWVMERRNLVQDYRRAFGEDPPEHVEVVALWSDSDQTGEEVEAYYGRAVARRK